MTNMLPCDIRYGPIFKTSLLGKPFIISGDPDFNHFIFQQEGRLFESWIPDTIKEILGQQNVGSLHTFLFKYLKSVILSLFGIENLKENLLPEVDRFANKTLTAWSSQPHVEVRDATSAVCIKTYDDLNPLSQGCNSEYLHRSTSAIHFENYILLTNIQISIAQSAPKFTKPIPPLNSIKPLPNQSRGRTRTFPWGRGHYVKKPYIRIKGICKSSEGRK